MKWLLRVKMMRISTIAIISCLVLLTSFAGYTVYGTQVGNWVVTVEDPSVALILSVNDDIDAYGTTRITVGGLQQQDNATYTDIPDNLAEGFGTNGSKNDTYRRRYLAFSFYLINVGEAAVDYEMSFDVASMKGNPLSAARFLLIEGDGDKSTGTIYAQPEQTEQAQQYLYDQLSQHGGWYNTVPIESESTIFIRQVSDLAVNTPVKYTFALWYEGCDLDCNNELFGSSIRLELTFRGY